MAKKKPKVSVSSSGSVTSEDSCPGPAADSAVVPSQDGDSVATDASGLQSDDGGADLPANVYEKYEFRKIHRSECTNAPYNPRILTDKAKRKLTAFIKENGLLGPINWNKRTGNVYGGNQRLKILDLLVGSPDYMLRVAAADITLKKEKELAVFLNNEFAQGSWDFELLSKMMSEDDFDSYAAGFDGSEIRQLLGGDPIGQDVGQLMEMAEAEREALEAYKGGSSAGRKSVAAMLRQQLDFYTVVVFRSDADRAAFHSIVGQGEYRCVDGRVLFQILKEAGDRRGKLPDDGWMTVDIECPRCGAMHHTCMFEMRSSAGSEFTHWIWCPDTHCPALIKNDALQGSEGGNEDDSGEIFGFSAV